MMMMRIKMRMMMRMMMVIVHDDADGNEDVYEYVNMVMNIFTKTMLMLVTASSC